MRDRLIELIENTVFRAGGGRIAEQIADNLLANGVVIADDDSDLECPLGGDETDDCADCSYAGDYHFVDGGCVRRE